MKKKYELLTDQTIQVDGRTLYRIRALRDVGRRKLGTLDIYVGGVGAGTLGGYVESENNLSHSGNCWIYEDAKVYENASIYDNAQIRSRASVRGNARVYDEARVDSNATVDGCAVVHGRALVTNSAFVYEHADVDESAYVAGNSRVFGRAIISGRSRVTQFAEVHGDACVYGCAMVSDYANVFGKARVYGSANVFGKAQVAGYCRLFGAAYIGRDASLGDTCDYLTIGPIGSEEGVLTAWRDAVVGVMVNRGCFTGTLTEFENKVKARHGDNIHGIMYGHAIAMIKAAFA